MAILREVPNISRERYEYFRRSIEAAYQPHRDRVLRGEPGATEAKLPSPSALRHYLQGARR